MVWISLVDLQWTGSPTPLPVITVAKVANEAVPPSSLYLWLQNKKEQVLEGMKHFMNPFICMGCLSICCILKEYLMDCLRGPLL